MKIYIFGTGHYYISVKDSIQSGDILCFLDNSEEKHGNILDGKSIIKPEEADYNECDYVLVLILRYEEAVQQLRRIGVPQNKVKLFSQFTEIYKAQMIVQTQKGNITTDEWLKLHHDEKKALLFCHELDRNGVSVVLMHLASLLKEVGYCVIEAGLLQGELQDELREKDIDSIAPINYTYGSRHFIQFVSSLDFVMAGTIGVADVVDKISGTGIPIAWWIHESNDKDFKDFKLSFKNNIHYFAGGSRVVECFKRFYPDKEIEKLLYFIPDIPCEVNAIRGFEVKMKVAVIGLINKRKGQDIFIKAIELLSEDLRENVEINFIGKYVEPVVDLKEIEQKYRINYIEGVTQEELQDYYKTLDVLVCPSRDDPMPVVVTQAMQNYVTCIVSDEVGQSEYITDSENGYVFKSEDYRDLSEKLKTCFSDSERTRLLGIKSREIYEKYFSPESMRGKLSKIVKEVKGE